MAKSNRALTSRSTNRPARLPPRKSITRRDGSDPRLSEQFGQSTRTAFDRADHDRHRCAETNQGPHQEWRRVERDHRRHVRASRPVSGANHRDPLPSGKLSQCRRFRRPRIHRAAEYWQRNRQSRRRADHAIHRHALSVWQHRSRGWQRIVVARTPSRLPVRVRQQHQPRTRPATPRPTSATVASGSSFSARTAKRCKTSVTTTSRRGPRHPMVTALRSKSSTHSATQRMQPIGGLAIQTADHPAPMACNQTSRRLRPQRNS